MHKFCIKLLTVTSLRNACLLLDNPTMYTVHQQILLLTMYTHLENNCNARIIMGACI